jgi:hypothetical protein
MKVHAVACAILIGVTSAPAFAGPTNGSRAPLFGDVVVRPPRAIPHVRGRSAAMMPFPRARPGAAPALAPAAAQGDSSPATGAAAAPAARPADSDTAAKVPQSFPPAVGLE